MYSHQKFRCKAMSYCTIARLSSSPAIRERSSINLGTAPFLSTTMLTGFIKTQWRFRGIRPGSGHTKAFTSGTYRCIFLRSELRGYSKETGLVNPASM